MGGIIEYTDKFIADTINRAYSRFPKNVKLYPIEMLILFLKNNQPLLKECFKYLMDRMLYIKVHVTESGEKKIDKNIIFDTEFLYLLFDEPVEGYFSKVNNSLKIKKGTCKTIEMAIYNGHIIIIPSKPYSQTFPIIIDCSNCIEQDINVTTIRKIISDSIKITYDSGYLPADSAFSLDYHKERINDLTVILKSRYVCVTYCEHAVWKMITTKIYLHSMGTVSEQLQCIEKFIDKKLEKMMRVGETLVLKGDCSTWEFIDVESPYLVEKLFYKIFVIRNSETEFKIINNLSPILLYCDYGLIGPSFEEERYKDIFRDYQNKIGSISDFTNKNKTSLVTLVNNDGVKVVLSSNQHRIILSMLAHNNFKIVKNNEIVGNSKILNNVRLNKLMFNSSDNILELLSVFGY